MPNVTNKLALQSIKGFKSQLASFSISDSVKVELDKDLTLSADCVVMFPNNTVGNSVIACSFRI